VLELHFYARDNLFQFRDAAAKQSPMKCVREAARDQQPANEANSSPLETSGKSPPSPTSTPKKSPKACP